MQLLVLIHGWTGDENSMWTLARNLPGKYSILAPRGPYPAPQGGYSWRPAEAEMTDPSSYNDLLPAAKDLLTFINEWTAYNGLQDQSFDLIGFSQGAAMTYVLWSLISTKIEKMAILSGFLPEGTAAIMTGEQIAGKRIFLSHGRKDEMVLIKQARVAEKFLRSRGAFVTYCESDAAHKVSKECLRSMEEFFIQDS